MHHTHFLKKNLRGFTLIELLVVIAIIGLLATIIVNPIQNARKKARDAKKVAELKAVETALEQYADANQGQYPANPNALAPQFIPVLPNSLTGNGGVVAKDRLNYVQYTSTGAATMSGYHLGVHLETNGPALDSDNDCTAVGTAVGATPSTGGFCAAAVGGTITYTTTLWTAGMLGASGGDFNGADGATSTCAAGSDCVFDLANYQ